MASNEAAEWLLNYHGSIDSTALLLAFDAGREHERDDHDHTCEVLNETVAEREKLDRELTRERERVASAVALIDAHSRRLARLEAVLRRAVEHGCHTAMWVDDARAALAGSDQRGEG
jgi:hypothetical protein